MGMAASAAPVRKSTGKSLVFRFIGVGGKTEHISFDPFIRSVPIL
jgi:hypothetical protein